MSTPYEKIANALAELDEDTFMSEIQKFVDGKPTTEDADEVVKACALGMEKVGDLFEEEEYFVGDLVYAAAVLTSGLDLVAPLLADSEATKLGTMVIGSAPGDLHDIGKNIFKSMAAAAGFEIYDLGVNVAPEAFAAKAKEVKADIVGISGLLTLSLDSMGDVIKALEAAGVRKGLKVMIGGNPVTEAVCKRIGADAFSTNASTGLKQCKEWMVS